MKKTPDEILNFWFKQSSKTERWQKDPYYDKKIYDHFHEVYQQAVAGELYQWRDKPTGRLAEIIVLDQFSRNMFRDTPQAFSADMLALALAQTAVQLNLDKTLPAEQRLYLYMPYMHSESKIIHEIAMTLFSCKGLEENLDYEIKHKAIIDKFGRYPHRNAILNRTSTPEEIAFLKTKEAYF